MGDHPVRMELVIPQNPAALSPPSGGRKRGAHFGFALLSSLFLAAASFATLHSIPIAGTPSDPPRGPSVYHADKNSSGSSCCGPLRRKSPSAPPAAMGARPPRPSALLSRIWIPFDRERFERLALRFQPEFWGGGGLVLPGVL